MGLTPPTSPTDTTSRLGFDSHTRGTGTAESDFTLSFSSVADRRYQVEWSGDLVKWSTLGSIIEGTGASIQITDPGALTDYTKRYYRMKLLDE